MEEATSSSVPPGFRFHPTDAELVGYYLRKKVASHKIDLNVIRDIDLYTIQPWDLQVRCRIGYEEQHEWYFFSHKDKKYPTGTRTNRATIAGFWKATGRDKAIYDKAKLIGMRKTLVFYKGRAPNGQKTDWIMHEYRLESHHNAPPQASIFLHEEGWVVCRAFKKRITNGCHNNKSIIQAGWDSTSFYDESTSSAVHPNIEHYTSPQPVPHHPLHRHRHRHRHRMFLAAGQGNSSFFCKQEEIVNNDQSENNNNLIISSSSNAFLTSTESFLPDLPQLESPQLAASPPPADNKGPNSSSYCNDNGNSGNYTSNYSNNNDDGGQLEEQVLVMENSNSGGKVTDWRALDKFVASQLMSQEERYDIDHHEEQTADAGFDLPPLQSGKEQGNKFGMSSGFLTSSSDCDFGICIFEK
ncbi:unnamed protein product [Linum tenue]|uniref:NAC domain-containing protein n=1 Tax=Linum tenue TaxID=586396 RepID=A0AAV0NTL7_9ROSI|nr:unnamed protein product [Linum tenue]